MTLQATVQHLLSCARGANDPEEWNKAVATATKLLHPQLRLILDLSIAHISDTTSLMLSEWADLAPPPGAAIVYEKGEYGYLIYVPSELPERKERPLVPDELWNLMVFAHALGCDWIMLDRDGVTLPNFPVFDW